MRALAAGPVLAMAVSLAACAQDDTMLVLHTSAGDRAFTVEIADTAKTRADGLMFRQSLAPDAGMLFDFFEEQEVSFWMQNTFIPLDMVFISSDGTVRHIHANAIPHDTSPVPSLAPVRFVLEIAGGRAAEIGLEVGDTVTHNRMGK